MASHLRMRTASLLATALVTLLALPAAVAAHGGITAGPYELELGWRSEPAVLGKPNAVQISVIDRVTSQPVTDLAAGDLVVVVGTAGRPNTTLALAPAFDAAAGSGLLGTYEAAFLPEAAGTYSFRVSGSIHDTEVAGILENFVDAEAEAVEPVPGPDPLFFIVGGAAVLALIAGMAFLFFRVRSVPAPQPARAAVPSKRKPPRR